MNSYSKRILCGFSVIAFFVAFFAVTTSHALTLHGIYTAACKREIGVIVDVDETEISFLTIEGRVVKIRPFEIIYLVQYPIDAFPARGRVNLSEVPEREIVTLKDGEKTALLKGWPIAFSSDKVSFLSERGQEIAISRLSIFEIQSRTSDNQINFTEGKSSAGYRFIHPYAFRNCSDKGNEGKPPVYPQQMLSQPVAIKREVDHYREGFDRLKSYEQEQKFYPVPLIYETWTSLGLWHSFGSRYGASEKRTNNLTPFLIDTYASDIYDYQHIIKTGSAPLAQLMHEEAQTQFFYAFKSSYFHLSGFFDPSLMLVGSNYEWKAGDFDKPDFRFNDTFFIEMGFDFGNWSTQLHLTRAFQYAGQSNSAASLFENNDNLNGFGLAYRTHRFLLEGFVLTGGNEHTSDGRMGTLDMSVTRVNWTYFGFKNWEFTYSFINRSSELTVKDGATFTPVMGVNMDSMTNSLVVEYLYRTRITVGGMVSAERVDVTHGEPVATMSYTDTYIKSGVYASLSF